LTTHIEIKNVTSRIKLSLIKNKIITLNNFYIKLFKKIPKIAILGLNPHNSENKKYTIENRIIKPAVVQLRKINIDINGPFPADTAFSKEKINSYNVIVGMYHDQVLAPFKSLYGYDAINITLGLKYIRISPDHGTAQDIVGLNKADPRSMINAINFLNKIND
jgi:4-hydroxythreonine-4-phosphate dehydrogenase